MPAIPVFIDIAGDRRLQGDHAAPSTGTAFLGAWRWPAGEGPFEIDMPLAREIQRSVIRDARASRWRDADVAWFRAQESGDTDAIAVAVAHKQALRDAPEDSSIGSATTPAALQMVTLDTILA